MSNPTPEQIEKTFWKSLRSEMTVMMGLPGKLPARPMTAIVEGEEDHGPIWFFTSSETELVKALDTPQKSELAFVDKGSCYATIHGTLSLDTDPQMIEALWNPYVAAWFEGKDDPKIRLVRLDDADAHIWLDASSLIEGFKMLIGRVDPKEDYKKKVAQVSLT